MVRQVVLTAKCNGIEERDDCSTTVFDATSSVIIPLFTEKDLHKRIHVSGCLFTGMLLKLVIS